MAKLTIMMGLPASGKTTKAEELLKVGNTVRINKDLLRTMLHFDKFTHLNERHTRMAAQSLADMFLRLDINVIIDDTNLNEGTLDGWKLLAKVHNAKIEYVDMTNVPVDRCIQNDFERSFIKVSGRSVGKHVIQKMALQYLEYMKGEKAVICDLDGTLCDITHRLHFVKGEKKDWKSFFAGISKDKIRQDVLAKLSVLNGNKIIFVSARPEEYREATEKWLDDRIYNQYRFKYNYMLIMRESHDKRDDALVKGEIYDKYLKNLNIIKVFDDRPKVIRMWREKGLNVEDVGDGVEF